MMLIFGCVELSRYVLITLKVQNAAFAMANIITQYPPATKSLSAGEINYNELTATLGGNQLKKMLAPFGNDVSREGMIVTSIRKEDAVNSTTPIIKWQVFTAGSITGAESIVTRRAVPPPAAFNPNQVTNFDVSKNPATANLATMRDGENAIVVEIFYNYTPLYTQVFSAINLSFPAFNFPGLTSQTITRQTFMVPRKGDLICLPGAGAAFLYTECL
jgi:hypothetical protein